MDEYIKSYSSKIPVKSCNLFQILAPDWLLNF